MSHQDAKFGIDTLWVYLRILPVWGKDAEFGIGTLWVYTRIVPVWVKDTPRPVPVYIVVSFMASWSGLWAFWILLT